MFKNLAVWLVIGLVLMTVFNQFNTRQLPQSSMEYSQFLEEVGRGSIAKVVIEGRVLKATEGRVALVRVDDADVEMALTSSPSRGLLIYRIERRA